MKQKHRRILEKYEKFGEFFNPAIDYEEKDLKFVNYGRFETNRPKTRTSKLKEHEDIIRNIEQANQPKLALCGASITKGLQRYSEIILWRVENLELPNSIEYFVIHCGTNNILRNGPAHIGDGVLSVGVMAKKKNPELTVIVTGLLHCDMNGEPMRHSVAEVNKIMRRKCKKLGFVFAEQDADWVDNDGNLNMDYYHSDSIHLNMQLFFSIVCWHHFGLKH